jgi:hypothetical protein
MVLPMKPNSKNYNITLKYMLYTPDIAFTLISIGKCDDTGYKTIFADQKCMIKSEASIVLLQAPKYHGLYHIDQQPAEFIANMHLSPINMYKRLRYISQKSMKRLFEHQMIIGLESKPSKDKVICDVWDIIQNSI